jgi:DNA-binding NtrC family response regulator
MGTTAGAVVTPRTDDADDPVKVLIVDDEPAIRRALGRVLSARGFEVHTAENGADGLEKISAIQPDVALVDMRMPVMEGLELLRRVKEQGSDVEVIMMTAHADMETAVSAVKLGAYHFLTKPFPSNDAVVVTCAKAAEHRRLLDRARRLEQRLEAQEQFGELIGTSPKMRAVYKLIDGVASATSTVLILGESGTGKELVARAIHQRSARANKPFVAVNCAAIPKELVESELFGHVRGAFTGAQSARTGLFESAHQGTILLDEVGDLPLAAQVKLLRTLQEGEVKRVGSDDTKIVDVRVLAATNVDLHGKIANGTFRRDLYYRLNVIALHLPPLRQRGDDVAVLAYHFVQKYARRMMREVKKITPEALEGLRNYSWPGNIRELEHAIEHAVVLAQGDAITLRDLPFGREDPNEAWALDVPTNVRSISLPAEVPTSMRSPQPPYDDDEDDDDETAAALFSSAPSSVALSSGSASPSSPGFPSSHAPGSLLPAGEIAADLLELPYGEAKRRALESFDRAYVSELLKRSGGNLSEAARKAGLDRSNFRRIVRKAK